MSKGVSKPHVEFARICIAFQQHPQTLEEDLLRFVIWPVLINQVMEEGWN